MMMLVVIPLLLAFAWLCRFGSRGFAQAANVEPPPPAAPPPADDIIGTDADGPAGSDWTALDDIQLTRLLNDSSGGA